MKAAPHFLFIEADARRAGHLESLIPSRGQGEKWTAEVVAGEFAAEFPKRLANFQAANPKAPVFAFVDPFGAGDEAAQLASELVQSPRAEVLIYVPTSFLNRFATQPDFEQTMDKLYGGRERWEPARRMLAGLERRQFLQTAFRERMEESCRWVRFFEITPAEGHNSYTLFFGTSHPLGLEKMKDAMWKLDPEGGASFKDSTTVDHPVLFEGEPPLAQLEELLRAKFGAESFSIEQAEEFTLYDTAFRHKGHLKPTLLAAERADRLEPVDPSPTRRGKSYVAGTVVRFKPQLL
jgi:three-Cys-motif partner protein